MNKTKRKEKEILDAIKDSAVKKTRFCVLLSFEDKIPLADVWDFLSDIYLYSSSRVILLLPELNIDESEKEKYSWDSIIAGGKIRPD